MSTSTWRRSYFGCICIATCLGAWQWVGVNAFAIPINPGDDYFTTPDGGAVFNPSHYPSIPGGPDIDIPMRGRSIYGLGAVDTVIRRSTGLSFPPIDPLGTMEAEIIALSLESMSPVPIGSSFFDVFVDLDPTRYSTGSVTITSHGPGTGGGGTFDSSFDVYARATLTEVGNPSNKMVFLIQDAITSTGATWFHPRPVDYPGPSGFIAPATPHTGPHPQTLRGTGPLLPESTTRRGYDTFVTPAGGGTFVDMGLLGIVQLEGVALPHISPGPVDTVVLRQAMGPLEGGIDKIEIQLVALHLKSSNPVDMTSVGGPPQADLHITVQAQNPDFEHPDFDLPVPIPVPDSTGQMEIQNFPGNVGGQFRACFGDEPGCDSMPNGVGLGVPGGGVHSNAIFVIPGGDPSNPAHVIQAMQAPTIFLSSIGQFQHGGTNRAGNFDMTAVSHTGPHPAQPDRVSVFVDPPDEDFDFNNDEIHDSADYVVWRKTDGSLSNYNGWRENFGEIVLSGGNGGTAPEPGSIAVVAVGILGVWLRRRRS